MQRREFLQSALGGLGGLMVLASCGGANPAAQSGPVTLSLANDKPSSAAQINELGKYMLDKCYPGQNGAGGFRLFRYITFPLLRPITMVIIAMTLVNSLQAFNLIWVMTQGGPYGSSSTLAVWMYNQSFVLYRMGYGSAIAVVLTFIVLATSIFYLRQSIGRE